MDVLIRRATEKDCKEMCVISEQYNNIIMQNRPDVAKSNLLGDDLDFFLRAIKDKNSIIYIAEKNNKAIGFVYAEIETHSDDLTNAPYVMVAMLIVDEKHKRSGIGKTLMDYAHKWACEKEIGVVHLAVHEFNKDAIAFYEKLGYTTIMRKMERILE